MNVLKNDLSEFAHVVKKDTQEVATSVIHPSAIENIVKSTSGIFSKTTEDGQKGFGSARFQALYTDEGANICSRFVFFFL